MLKAEKPNYSPEGRYVISNLNGRENWLKKAKNTVYGSGDVMLFAGRQFKMLVCNAYMSLDHTVIIVR